ncbi:MAG: hypothetical protein ACE5FD_01255 [Anaerolineae bacterium]
MAEPDDFVTAMEKFRAALLARERRAAVRLVNAYGAIYEKLQADIEALADEIAALSPQQAGAAKLGKLRAWKALRAGLVDEMSKFEIIFENHLAETAPESVRAGIAEARLMAAATLPGASELDAKIMATWRKLPAQVVENLLGFLDEGAPLKKSLAELGPALAEQVEEKLVTGLALGWNPRKTARFIRAELGQGLTWALRTARTVNLYAYREANRASYIANNHIVKGWRWRAKLEGSCLSCIAMDGTAHDLDERLNDHHNGQCWMEPITATYKELGFDVAEPPRPERQTGQEWFEGLGEGRQRQIMGQARFEAWREGKFKFNDLSGARNDPVWGEMRVAQSLKQLAASQ